MHVLMNLHMCVYMDKCMACVYVYMAYVSVHRWYPGTVSFLCLDRHPVTPCHCDNRPAVAVTAPVLTWASRSDIAWLQVFCSTSEWWQWLVYY